MMQALHHFPPFLIELGIFAFSHKKVLYRLTNTSKLALLLYYGDIAKYNEAVFRRI